MSKRRKNAGEGYGYMFHGAFAKKADAVAKERKTKGAWVKGTLTNRGYRYLVMSPRTNPRRKKNPSPEVAKAKAIAAFRKMEELTGKGKFARADKMRMQLAKLNTRMGWTMADVAGFARGENPSELLIMGANPEPHESQEIVARPGQTITIRVNPTALASSSDDSRYMLAAAAQLFPGKSLSRLTAAELSKVAQLAARLKRGENPLPYFGFGPSSPSRKELAESRRGFKRRVSAQAKEIGAEYSRLRRSARAGFRGKRKLRDLFHEVYGANPGRNICGARIGGDVCTREPGHCGPHLPQGATMRPQSRHNCKPRGNPSAAELRETFTGREAESIATFREPHMRRGNYAQLGKLLALYVKPHAGGQVQVIHPKGTLLVADETARQLWFVGGDQDISQSLGVFGARERGPGLFELGEARRIDYKQRKEHVPEPDVDEWRHEFGEESGVRPVVLFDAASKRLLLEGGEYSIKREGIIN